MVGRSRRPSAVVEINFASGTTAFRRRFGRLRMVTTVMNGNGRRYTFAFRIVRFRVFFFFCCPCRTTRLTHSPPASTRRFDKTTRRLTMARARSFPKRTARTCGAGSVRRNRETFSRRGWKRPEPAGATDFQQNQITRRRRRRRLPAIASPQPVFRFSCCLIITTDVVIYSD